MRTMVTAFLDEKRIAVGEREAVTREIEERYPDALGAIRAFDDASGRIVDLDYWDAGRTAPEPRGRGRPKLGVTAREITLLPRQWEWLAAQPGGASAALRRLVDEARRKGEGADDPRRRRDAAYHFMQAACGDRPGYEEALRALYQGDGARFDALVAGWPKDIGAYLSRLLADD